MEIDLICLGPVALLLHKNVIHSRRLEQDCRLCVNARLQVRKSWLCLFLTLSGSGSSLWEVVTSSSRHNVITWGVIHGRPLLGSVINSSHNSLAGGRVSHKIVHSWACLAVMRGRVEKAQQQAPSTQNPKNHRKEKPELFVHSWACLDKLNYKILKTKPERQSKSCLSIHELVWEWQAGKQWYNRPIPKYKKSKQGELDLLVYSSDYLKLIRKWRCT